MTLVGVFFLKSLRQPRNNQTRSGDEKYKRLKYNKDPFEVMSQTTATDFNRHDDYAHPRTQQRAAAAARGAENTAKIMHRYIGSHFF